MWKASSQPIFPQNQTRRNQTNITNLTQTYTSGALSAPSARAQARPAPDTDTNTNTNTNTNVYTNGNTNGNTKIPSQISATAYGSAGAEGAHAGQLAPAMAAAETIAANPSNAEAKANANAGANAFADEGTPACAGDTTRDGCGCKGKARLRPLEAGEEEAEERTLYALQEEKEFKACRAFGKKLLAIIVLAIAAFLCILGAAIGAALNASADTVAYTSQYKHKLDIGITMTTMSGATEEYVAYLYGDAAGSGTDTVSSGCVLDYAPTTLEITIPKGYSVTQYATVMMYGRIYDFSLSGPVSFSDSYVYVGSMSADETIKYTFSGLTDGTYTISFSKDEYTYTYTTLGGKKEAYKGAATASFTFTVDTVPPDVSGAYPDADNPLYTSTGFTVSATDTGTGVSSLGYQTPSSGSFVWGSDTSRTFTLAGGGEGLYKFAAEDNAGNVSGYFYVYLDATAPALSADGAGLNEVTDGSFSVSATDASGTATLYYCKTETGTWITAESGTVTIPYTNGDGEYQFYAMDAAGNTSEKYYVILSTADIEGFFVKSDTDNSQYFYWNNTNWTATLDGEPYERGTWISTEGTHSIILTSRYGDTLEYSCSIDHFYIAAGVTEATCSQEGCTIYLCVHCGDAYSADFTPVTKHDYRALYTMPTCTEDGYMTYTCTECGYSYTDVCTPATGHYYTRTVIEPTCEQEGYALYECIVCHDSYTADYTAETDHDYNCVYTAPTCTSPGLYTYTCSVCGDTYAEESGLPTEHTYEITVIKSPTCEEDGERHYMCTVCGYEFYMTVPATGHDYVIASQYTEDGETMRVYQCEDCGDEYTEDLGNQNEYVAGFVDELFSAYSSYMWWILLAAAGVWSIVMGVMFIRARRAEDKDKARRMLVNYLLGLVIIAVILVAAPYLAYGIASLVT